MPARRGRREEIRRPNARRYARCVFKSETRAALAPARAFPCTIGRARVTSGTAEARRHAEVDAVAVAADHATMRVGIAAIKKKERERERERERGRAWRR